MRYALWRTGLIAAVVVFGIQVLDPDEKGIPRRPENAWMIWTILMVSLLVVFVLYIRLMWTYRQAGKWLAEKRERDQQWEESQMA